MSSDAQPDEYDAGPPFQDRSTALAVFGGIQVVLGAGSILIALFMLAMTGTGPPDIARTMIPVVALYSLKAGVLVSLGFGSILCQRWARALTLVLAWIFIVNGIFAVIPTVSIQTAMFNSPVQGRPMPQEMISFIRIMSVGLLGVFYFLLPGIVVYFYQNKDTKATCEFKDPKVRWTDKCPLPVLALCVLPVFSATGMFMTFGNGRILPLFGVLLKGWPAGLGLLGVTLIFVALIWGTYKLKMAAWWGSLLMYVGCGLSYLITLLCVEPIEFFRGMNLPEEQLEMMQKSGVIEQMNLPLTTGLWTVGLVIYLFWVRRYFVKADSAEASTDFIDKPVAD